METPITTTLKKIRAHKPCGIKRNSYEGYDLLRKNLGKGYGDNTPIRFSQIIESNGVADAVWCLRSICPEYEKEVRLFAADCAESVLHLFQAKFPHDNRPRKAIQDARDFANGLITKEPLKMAVRAVDDTTNTVRAVYAVVSVAAYLACTADADAAAEYAAYAAAAYACGAAGYAYAADAADAADAAYDDQREKQKQFLIERFG